MATVTVYTGIPCHQNMMRVLIDTNIFIHLEGSAVLDSSYPALLRVLEEIKAQTLIHPSSFEDLKRDKDSARRDLNLSKAGKYAVLDRPPDCRAEFSNRKINCAGDNNAIDCAILCAVYRDAVHFLITEDNGIHRKAKALGVDQRVFYVQQAVASFAATFGKTAITLPNIEQVYAYEIKDSLNTPFFDSLRNTYSGFDTWFNEKCCREGRESWIARDSNGELAALCIFNPADPEPLTDDGKALAGKALKLCTFKVGPTIRGQKVGELFLKAAFKYAHQNKLENIFLTVKVGEQPLLEQLLTDFGFDVFGRKGDELVMVKIHPPKSPPSSLDPLEYHKRFSPHIMAIQSVRKFIVPIQPKYHEILFPDFSGTQLKLDLRLGVESPQQIVKPGNAIKLAYLCHSAISTIRPGDILLFYRSKDFQEVTSIGIVETAEHLADAQSILKRVLKRTVYGAREIDKMSVKSTLVILFRLGFHFPNPVSKKFLESNGVIGNIQSIRQIEHSAFTRIAQQASIEDCLFAN